MRGYAEIKFTRGAVIQRGQLFTDVSENTKFEDKRCPIGLSSSALDILDLAVTELTDAL